jgi:hypothetical protein
MVLDLDRVQMNSEVVMDIQVEYVGEQCYPILLVDHFYADPDYVRQLALNLEYSNDFLDGICRSLYVQPKGAKKLARISLDLSKIVTFIYKQWANTYVEDFEKFRSSFVYEEIFSTMGRWPGGFDAFFAKPQVNDVLLSGVIYLNLPEQCRGGMGFYRHRRTKFSEFLDIGMIDEMKAESSRFDQSVLRKVHDMTIAQTLGDIDHPEARVHYQNTLESIHHSRIIRKNYVTGSDEDWELVKFIEMKYNRMVFYPSFIFHAQHHQDNWFGNSLEEMRLMQEFLVPWPAA